MANTIGWGQAAVNNTIDWGKGKTNNTIGWGTIYSSSPYGDTDLIGTPAGDADANAFISAAAITDATQKSAIDKLVVDLKGYGIWTKMKAIYPFCGGTAAQHKFNLKTPIDSDSAFRLTFSGGWLHSNNGILSNGTNTFADTKLIPNLITAQNSFSYGVYSRTNVDQLSVDIGCVDSGGISTMLLSRFGNIFQTLINSGVQYTNSANTNSLGFFVGNRTASNVIKNYKNGALLTTGNIGSGGNNNKSVYIGNTNHTINYPSTRQYAFSFISDGLTDTEAANYYTAVQAFQTTLGRNV
jgi:hypothetical protein